jgi:outer membrane receptor protein involved in Fe transport
VSRLRIGAWFSAGPALLAVTLPAHAQHAGPAHAGIELSDVVVTGTRILHAGGQSATLSVIPVAPEELNDRGVVNLGDALNDLPALRATWSQANSSRFIGTAGMNWLDLRGLGPERTLVLVNNRRHVTSSPGDNYVDVNSIPSGLLERVDLVTGGNSAVYGSEAVAGVVNFITRRDFDGLNVNAQAGTSSRDDRASNLVALVAGRNFAEDRGNVALAIEWQASDALDFHQRESLTGSRGGRRSFNLSEDPSDDPGGSDGIIDNPYYDGGLFDGTNSAGGLVDGDGRIFTFDAEGNLVETVPDLDLRPYGTPVVRNTSNAGGLVTYTETGQLAPGLERYSVNLLVHLDVSEAFRPFLEAKFAHIDVVQTIGPSSWRGSITGYFYGPDYDGEGPELRCSNPFLSAQALGVLQSLGRCTAPDATFEMSRRNLDFGPRGELHDRDTYRVVAGFDGVFQNGWHYEVAANYGRLDTRMRSLNNLVLFDLGGNADGFLLAIDAVRDASGEIVCGVNADANPSNDRPDCVPINVFGPGAPSQEAIHFVNMTGLRDERAEQFVISAFVSGELPAGGLPAGAPAFALGAEYRSERAWSVYDELSAAGATFQNAIPPFHPPDLSVAEAYAELRVPLLSDRHLVRELTAEAAARMSNYNNSMDRVAAWNFGVIYSPASELGLHANFSTSVRAPTQADLFRPLTQDFAPINDPCDVLYVGNNPNRAVNCAAHGLPPDFENVIARSQAISFLQGGNPALVEEEGDSYTIGARYTPAFLPGLSLSVDYYDIEVTNLISPASAQGVLNACYDSPSGVDNAFCEVINRVPESGLFASVALVTSGFNYARQETEGLDLDVSFETQLGNSRRLSARLLATRVFELNNFLDLQDPDVPNRALGEIGDPELALNFDLGYAIADFSLRYALRYVNGQTIGFYEEQHAFNGNPPTDADIYPRKRYPSAAIHAIRGEYAFSDALRVFGGVDNLTDSLAPLGLLGNLPGEPYDTVGRYFYFGLTYDL